MTEVLDIAQLGRKVSALAASGLYEQALSLLAAAFALEGPAMPYIMVQQSVALAQQLGDHACATEFMNYLCTLFESQGDTRGKLHAALGRMRMRIQIGALDEARLWWRTFVLPLDPDAQPSRSLLDGVEAVLGPNATDDARALLRCEAARTLALYHAASGRLSRARACLRMALRIAEAATPTTRPWMLEHETALFAAELAVDAGFFAATERMPEQLSRELKQRWQLLEVRACSLRGHLSRARELGTTLVAEASPSSPIALRAAHALAWVLLALNRLGDLLTLIEHATHDWSAADPRRASFTQLRKLAALRASLAEQEETLAFVPQQASLEHDETVATQDTAARASLVLHASERSLDHWGALSNGVMLAIAAGRDGRDELALARALAERCDSKLIAAKHAYLAALVEYYARRKFALPGREGLHLDDVRAKAANARGLAEQCGLLLDAWQASRLEAWCTRTTRRDYEDARHRSQQAMHALESRLDADDRVFFSLNKTSARDEYVVTQLRRAGTIRPSWLPLPGLARWLERRRRTAQALAALESLTALTQWSVELALDPASAGEAVDADPRAALAGHQVERLVKTQLAIRRARKWRAAARSARAPQRALGDTEAFLQYYIAPDATFAIVVDKHQAAVLELPVTRVALDLKLFGLHRVLQEEGELLAKTPESGLLDDLRDRREALLVEVHAMLGLDLVMQTIASAVRTLFIVPHDVLTNAPFAALGGRQARLIDRVEISLLPSAQALGQTRLDARSSPIQRLLAVGVAKFAPRELSELPATADEARELAQLIADGRALCDHDATRARLLSLVESVDWVHFATHAEFDLEAPHNSRLHLSSDGTDEPWLSVSEVARSSWGKVRGVAMSACTASVQIALPGQELVGFPSAWLQAGVRHVVAPIWELDDEPGRKFMLELYRELTTQSSIGSVADVQRKWASSPDPELSSPFRWAGFVHHGR